MSDYNTLFQSVSVIAQELQGLHTLAVAQYTPAGQDWSHAETRRE